MPRTNLTEAVRPVAKHHYGARLTEESVLAAYIRAQGAWPTKQALSSGLSRLADGIDFEQVAIGLVENGLAPVRIPTQSGAPAPREPAAPRRAAPASAPRLDPDTPPKATPHEAETLEWFPKPNALGDLNGEGAVKMLGTPNVPLSTVLVRETAQNSWDARLGNKPIDYEVHLRTLSDTEAQVLETRVFTGEATKLGLREALRRRPLRVLEISDRGTTGLDGPIRADLEIGPGMSRNFVDLIFNIGAPRDVHLGAGTYGFGKTITYRVSNPRTVLFWSRTRVDHSLQHRLIGSAFGPSFSAGGVVYTGRHWWGQITEDGTRVEPWIGHRAQEMAEDVFAARFHGTDTGTTLLVVDPELGGHDDHEDLQRLSDAIIWNLWPKLLTTPTGSKPMNIRLLHNGHPVDLPDVNEHPQLQGFAEALQMVRAQQGRTTFAPRFDTKVEEIWLERPRVLVGHLGLCRFPRMGGTNAADSETRPIQGPTGHVAWMRHDAELIVRYDERQKIESDYVQWAAVFRPMAAVDDSFAQSEPPAHDDWVPASISNSTRKRHVNVGIRRVREKVQEWLRPTAGQTSSATSRVSVAALADKLAALTGAIPGFRSTRRNSGAKTGATRTGRARPKVDVLRHEVGRIDDGWRTTKILVKAGEKGPRTEVHAKCEVATDGKPLADESFLRILGWAAGEDQEPDGSASAVLAPGQTAWLVVETQTAVTLQVTLSAEEED